MNVFVARQPIFDSQLRVHGYELLYRRSDIDTAEFIDGDAATSSVILNTFTEFGIENLTYGRTAYINLTRKFFLDQYLPLPKDKVVIELLEDIEPDKELIDALRRLSKQGYTIAIDDFVLDTDERERLFPYVDIVKVDVFDLSPQQIIHHARILRRHRIKTLLAEKIETEETMKLCRSSGFDYFQGFFLSRPSTLSRSSVPSSRLPLLQLIATLQKPDANVQELEQIIGQDIALSYKLLRYLASPIFPSRNIESIRAAVLYLGQRDLANWATLLALTTAPDQPSERIVSILLRAHVCSQLASRTGIGDPGSAFTIGLFSGLDAVLNAPLDVICAELPLTAEISKALLEHSGPQGDLLAATLAQEQGQWGKISQLGFAPELLAEVYLESIRRADEQWAWLSRAAAEAQREVTPPKGTRHRRGPKR